MGIHLPDGWTLGQTEYAGLGKPLAAELKDLLLDAPGYATTPVLGPDYQTGIGDKLSILPGLHIAETYKYSTLNGNDGLALPGRDAWRYGAR